MLPDLSCCRPECPLLGRHPEQGGSVQHSASFQVKEDVGALGLALCPVDTQDVHP